MGAGGAVVSVCLSVATAYRPVFPRAEIGFWPADTLNIAGSAERAIRIVAPFVIGACVACDPATDRHSGGLNVSGGLFAPGMRRCRKREQYGHDVCSDPHFGTVSACAKM